MEQSRDGGKTGTLEEEGFRAITPYEKRKSICEFNYLDIAKITVINPNDLTVEVDKEINVDSVENKLREICDRKGVFLSYIVKE